VNIKTDIIVLGAGYAGLTASALLAHEGKDTVLLESHDTLGGCASFFRKGQYTFDVGATTFSGVKPEQPVGRVFRHLGLTPNLVQQDPGIIVRMHHGDVLRWADKDRWITEAQKHFSGDQQGFWNQQYRIERRVWDLVGSSEAIPPTSVRDVLKLIRPRMLRGLALLPGMIRPVSVLADKWNVHGSRFDDFLREQLLISTQNDAEHAPYLTGAMGLTYPSETYYPMGGMVRPALMLMRHATSKGASVQFRRVVQNIEQRGNQWLITCSSGDVYTANTVVSSIPIWNMGELTHGRVRTYFEAKAKKHHRSWCALTMYFALDGTPDLASTYVQLFLDEEIPYVHSHSVFLTVSPKADVEKAPAGHCTVTVSTHAESADWIGLSQEETTRRKHLVMNALMQIIDRRMPEFAGMKRIHLEGGTPATWEHYTRRFHGYVGGVPHDVQSPLIMMPPNQTPFTGLYMIGDSVFPGQGTPAVMLGAWNTVRRIFAS